MRARHPERGCKATISLGKTRWLLAVVSQPMILTTEIGAGLGWVSRWWIAGVHHKKCGGGRGEIVHGWAPIYTDLNGKAGWCGLGLGCCVGCRRFLSTENVEVHGKKRRGDCPRITRMGREVTHHDHGPDRR
jgi:hypothetical protein